jgi:cell division protein FtsQ
MAWRVGRVVVPLVLLAGTAWWGSAMVTAAPVFSVRQVLVSGNAHLSVADVETLVGGLRGTNILRADLDRYRRQLMDSPWVGSVTLARILPSTVDIRIVERTPMAVARLGQRLYLVDDTGMIIDEFGPQYAAYDLPIIDGLISAPQKGVPAVDADRVRLTSRFLLALAGHAELRQRISQVDVSDPHDARVMLVDGPAWLRLGDDRFVERLTTYFELVPTLGEQFTDVDYVDLRFGDHVAVGARGRAPAPGGGR